LEDAAVILDPRHTPVLSRRKALHVEDDEVDVGQFLIGEPLGIEAVGFDRRMYAQALGGAEKPNGETALLRPTTVRPNASVNCGTITAGAERNTYW
jgi:hypothetical protein